jgi:hypothetical protein
MREITRIEAPFAIRCRRRDGAEPKEADETEDASQVDRRRGSEHRPSEKIEPVVVGTKAGCLVLHEFSGIAT